jgi:ribonuclease HII
MAAGARFVAGIDEVGRGALAGPVVAAAVILRPEACAQLADAGVRDSKQLTGRARAELVPLIRAGARAWAIGAVGAATIDLIGIARATELAMSRALAGLTLRPDYLLVDGYPNRLDPRPQLAIFKGDRRSLSIASASILAKVWRDAAMIDLDRRLPGYHFDRHKGYGTAEHRQAIRLWGASAWHRLSWNLVGSIGSAPDSDLQVSLPGLAAPRCAPPIALDARWLGQAALLGRLP